MKSNKVHPGWRARHRYVEEIVRMQDYLIKAHERLCSQKKYPIWLAIILNDEISRCNIIMGEMEQHRDEIAQYLEEKP